MRVVIGYESMYGTTRRVAEAICDGFKSQGDDVTVGPIAKVADQMDRSDVVVVGVPTHVHGMPKPTTRRAALDQATKRYQSQEVDPSATVDYGVREWLAQLQLPAEVSVATFDTRAGLPMWLTGHPARQVARAVVARGGRLLAAPESFLLDKQEQLRSGELERAREWGGHLRMLAERHAGATAQS